MKNEKLLQAIGKIDDELVYGAVNDTKAKKKKNTWIKWGAMAACLCLVVVGVLSIHNAKPTYQIALNYNEVSSVMSSGTPVSAKTATVEATAGEVSELLGYDIDSCIPSAMKSYIFKYTTIQDTDTNEIFGVIVTGREDGDDTNRPGIWIEVSFGGTRPLIDYDYEYEKMVYSTINGIEACATVIPQNTFTNAAGEEKTRPAVYTATYEQGECFYYVESRGTLEQVVFDELVCALIDIFGIK